MKVGNIHRYNILNEYTTGYNYMILSDDKEKQ